MTRPRLLATSDLTVYAKTRVWISGQAYFVRDEGTLIPGVSLQPTSGWQAEVDTTSRFRSEYRLKGYAQAEYEFRAVDQYSDDEATEFTTPLYPGVWRVLNVRLYPPLRGNLPHVRFEAVRVDEAGSTLVVDGIQILLSDLTPLLTSANESLYLDPEAL
jgi:hypothetical protein